MCLEKKKNTKDFSLLHSGVPNPAVMFRKIWVCLSVSLTLIDWHGMGLWGLPPLVMLSSVESPSLFGKSTVSDTAHLSPPEWTCAPAEVGASCVCFSCPRENFALCPSLTRPRMIIARQAPEPHCPLCLLIALLLYCFLCQNWTLFASLSVLESL